MPRSAGNSSHNFALMAVGLAVLIVYGSLYPFQFEWRSTTDPFWALITTWSAPTGRGDVLANLLLYFPLGVFLFAALDRLRIVARFAVVISTGLALSTAVELAQLYDQGHISAMADVYADTTGTILGAAASLVLFAVRRGSRRPRMDRRPFIILLLCSWLGYRLAPFAPTIDLHKYWDVLKPLVHSPVVAPLDLYRHTVIVLVVAVALEALFGVTRSRFATLAFVSGVLAARVFITDILLSPAEVLGGVLGVIAWNALLSRSRHRSRLVTGLFVAMVILQALEPFEFSHRARTFEWIPFLGFLQGSVEVNVRSFFEKAFTYGALVWLTIRAGFSFAIATGISTGIVFGLRLVQTFLPGRSAEITDVILVLIMAAVLKLMGEDPAQNSANEDGRGWLDSWFYESLTQTDSPEPVDLIFVMAGRMERKHYGLELFREGLSPRLLLSVGRFEVSRMHTLGLDGIGRLTVLRDQTPPDDRNFFVELDSEGVRIEKSQLPRCSTYGEILGLRTFLAKRQVRRVMVISTDVHLRRSAMVFDRIFRDVPIKFLYCPVPSRFGFLERDGWWKRADDRMFVVKECVKLLGYWVILSTPVWAVRRLMRLKDVNP